MIDNYKKINAIWIFIKYNIGLHLYKYVNSIYGGLIASGWHTISMCMRLIVDNMLIPDSGCLGSPGADNVMWSQPVRPGDILKVKAELLEKIPSKSKPDRGFWVIKFIAFNQNNEDVMNMTIKINLRKR